MRGIARLLGSTILFAVLNAGAQQVGFQAVDIPVVGAQPYPWTSGTQQAAIRVCSPWVSLSRKLRKMALCLDPGSRSSSSRTGTGAPRKDTMTLRSH